ncbi:unnamed protein product, partial [Mesorhabditis belari]|uniref:LNS2/PITP domain-containing protein n=1 Tax=Mesorhabditis belari TaxID=2138241 RepID=A0AAF3F133_9BILA
MDYAYRVVNNIRYFYNTINPATLSGAIDVVVVEQPDGTLKSTPFHVRFGKYGVFSHTEKYVDITINGEEIDLKMKLGQNGVAFFVEETEDKVPDYLATSPLPEGVEAKTTQQVDTDQILNESARKLEEHKRSYDPKTRLLSEGSDVSESRSPTPPPTKSTQETWAQKEAKAAEKEKERKLALPRLSSVFSQRRNRSLPDLTTVADQHHGYLTEEDHTADQITLNNNAKKGKVEVDLSPVQRKFSQHSSMFNHKRSLSNKGLPIEPKMSIDEFLKSLKAERKLSSSVRRKKSRVAFATEPISIHIETEHDGDVESETASSSTLSSPSGSLVDGTDVDALADGCLSDSEVDRHNRRDQPRPQASDVTDWQWGQLPETREDQEKRAKEQKKGEQEKPKERSSSSSWWSGWSWRGRSPASSPAKPTESREKKKTEEEPGIYLDDLVGKGAANDPVQIEKYLGKSAPISLTYPDSGHGSSGGPSQPSSPTVIGSGASSDNDICDKTPTQETVAAAISIAAKSKQKQQQTVEEGDRRRNASDQRSTTSDTIFPFSEDEGDEIEIEGGKKYYRSLRLSSDKLKQLGLEMGVNDVRFSITTKFQGTTWCSCNVYLYKWYEKIVISDIDGTITKSDVLGHVIPAIGGQWAHTGVAELYSRIKDNGYKIVYLSSRAIGQSHTTKQYLKSVAQEQQVLPDGPVLLSPTSVLVAFRREVIERRPEEFKIAALSDLRKLFPVKHPFFSGFGNRETDTVSYRAVDIPISRILIIDPSGKVRRADSKGLVSTYLSMATDTVDFLFPPLARRCITRMPDTLTVGGEKLYAPFAKPLTHSSFAHWRQDEVTSMQDEILVKYETERKELEKIRKSVKK